MSFPALAWASLSKVTRAADKLVLLGLADRHNSEHGLAYPSIAWLSEFSSLDRKTVVTALGRLEDAGFISDSGKRVGKTKQVKAYLLNMPEIGTVITGPFGDKGSGFSGEESRKRNTEPVLNRSEAKASYQVAVDLWNELSAGSKIPAVRVLNNSRKQMFAAREREHGLPAILEAVRNIHASPFCRGGGGARRKADIMYILQPQTLARAIEGYYGTSGAPKITDPTIIAANKRSTADLYDKMGRGQEAAQLRREADELERQLAA